MSATPQLLQQLQQDLQNELTTSNQLLRLIALEVKQIKQFTGPGGEFEDTVKKNAKLTSELGKILEVDIDNLEPLMRIRMDTSNEVNQNLSYEQQHDSVRENSNMEDSAVAE